MFNDRPKVRPRKTRARKESHTPEQVYSELDKMMLEGEKISLINLRHRLKIGSFSTLAARIRNWKQNLFNKLAGDTHIVGDVMVDDLLMDGNLEAPTRKLVYQVGVVMELSSSELQGLQQLPAHVDTKTLPGMYVVSVKPVGPVKLVFNPQQFEDFQLRVASNMFRHRAHAGDDLAEDDHAIGD